MRDIFEEMFAERPADPVEAARRAMRPVLRRRFYRRASAGAAAGGYALLLDGKPARTPAGRALVAPVRPLAEAVAAEWEVQDSVIDPQRMPLTRLANAIIDGVAGAAAAVAADTARYLGSDLLFYRAEGPAGLVARQERHWDPILRWAREALGAHFILIQGVVFAAQPAPALAAAVAAIPSDIWRLGAVHAMTTLTGSALIALAVARGRLTPEEGWTAAHVDEDWNMDLWGRDADALERRARRYAEFAAAASLLAWTDGKTAAREG